MPSAPRPVPSSPEEEGLNRQPAQCSAPVAGPGGRFAMTSRASNSANAHRGVGVPVATPVPIFDHTGQTPCVAFVKLQTARQAIANCMER